MGSVYPEAAPTKAAPPVFKPGECAAQIIYWRAMKPNITKVLVAGKIIHTVGGTVTDIYGVWDGLEAERVKWAAVNPSDFSTVTAFKAGLVAQGQEYLDETLWYNGLKAKFDVSSFADLKTATKPAAEM